MDAAKSSRREGSGVGVLTLVISVLWLVLGAANIANQIIFDIVAGRDVPLGQAFLTLLVSTTLSVMITPVLIYLLRLIRHDERFGVAAWIHFIGIVFAVAILRVFIGHLTTNVMRGRPLTWEGLRMALLLVTHIHVVYVALGAAVVLLYDNAQADLERERLRAALTVSRLQQLRAQFRPHFLLNTLNTIATLVHREPKTADDVVTSLGTLLRWTIGLDDVAEVTLKEELAFVQHYLSIQQVRFGARLEASIDAPDDTLQCTVLPLALQPLVENAMIHGLPHAHPTGRLRITARIDGGALVLQVRDNGSADPAKVRRGTGLKNLEERLRAMYGGRGTLSFYSEADEFVAEVRMPARSGD
jgi:anti-sigma regulatory factor (Ser/Thr protein kinase)